MLIIKLKFQPFPFSLKLRCIRIAWTSNVNVIAIVYSKVIHKHYIRVPSHEEGLRVTGLLVMQVMQFMRPPSNAWKLLRSCIITDCSSLASWSSNTRMFASPQFDLQGCGPSTTPYPTMPSVIILHVSCAVRRLTVISILTVCTETVMNDCSPALD